jgi:hypothetical protein
MSDERSGDDVMARAHVIGAMGPRAAIQRR